MKSSSLTSLNFQLTSLSRLQLAILIDAIESNSHLSTDTGSDSYKAYTKEDLLNFLTSSKAVEGWLIDDFCAMAVKIGIVKDATPKTIGELEAIVASDFTNRQRKDKHSLCSAIDDIKGANRSFLALGTDQSRKELEKQFLYLIGEEKNLLKILKYASYSKLYKYYQDIKQVENNKRIVKLSHVESGEEIIASITDVRVMLGEGHEGTKEALKKMEAGEYVEVNSKYGKFYASLYDGEIFKGLTFREDEGVYYGEIVRYVASNEEIEYKKRNIYTGKVISTQWIISNKIFNEWLTSGRISLHLDIDINMFTKGIEPIAEAVEDVHTIESVFEAIQGAKKPATVEDGGEVSSEAFDASNVKTISDRIEEAISSPIASNGFYCGGGWDGYSVTIVNAMDNKMVATVSKQGITIQEEFLYLTFNVTLQKFLNVCEACNAWIKEQATEAKQ